MLKINLRRVKPIVRPLYWIASLPVVVASKLAGEGDALGFITAMAILFPVNMVSLLIMERYCKSAKFIAQGKM